MSSSGDPFRYSILEGHNRGFQNLGVITILGVPITRIIVYWCLDRGLSTYGNYHVELQRQPNDTSALIQMMRASRKEAREEREGKRRSHGNTLREWRRLRSGGRVEDGKKQSERERERRQERERQRERDVPLL